jgi:potassium efflux system protein
LITALAVSCGCRANIARQKSPVIRAAFGQIVIGFMLLGLANGHFAPLPDADTTRPMNLNKIAVLALLPAAFLWIFLVADSPRCAAQQVPAATPAAASVYDALRKRVSAAELSEDEKKPILAQIDQAESQAKEAVASREAATAFQDSIASLDNRVDDAQSELDSLQDFQPPPMPSQSLTELEALLTKIDTDLAAAKSAVSNAESLATRAPQKLRELEAKARDLDSQLAECRSQIDAAAQSEPSLSLDAAKLELAASEQLLLAKLETLRQEAALIKAEMTAGFFQLDWDLKAQRVNTIQQHRMLVDEAVESARLADATRRVKSAESQLSTLHRALRPIGEQNQQFADMNNSLAAKIAEVEESLDASAAELEKLRSRLQQAKTVVDTIGLTEAVGSMLRDLTHRLVKPNFYRWSNKERQPLINEAQYTLIDLTNRRNANVDIVVAVLLNEAQPPIPEDQKPELVKEAKALLARQRTEFLDPAIRSQRTYFNTLVSLSATEQQIVQLIEETKNYVDQRVLWIRSTKPLTAQLAPAAEERWFLLPKAWDNVGGRIVNDIQTYPVLWGAAILALVGLIRFRWQLRKEIAEIGQHVNKATHTAFSPTLQSLVLTIATAAPVPLIFGFLAWRFHDVAGDDRALLALAAAAKALALVMFPIELLRQTLRYDGLAVSHFGWHDASCRRLRRWLRPLSLTVIPALVIASFLQGGRDGNGQDTLERYFFIFAMGALGFLLARLLRPSSGLPSNYLRIYPDGWAKRLSYIWYPLIVAAPVTLIGMTVLGYYFTSQQLAQRFFLTFCLLLGIVLAGALASRWMLLRRRRLLIEQSRRHDDAAKQPALADELPIEPQEPTAEQLRSQVRQTQRLLTTVMLGIALVGMWFTWSDVLFSQRISEDWWVWQSTVTVSETVTSDGGEPVTRTRQIMEKVTVADIISAVLVMIVTILATRNIPGLLEFALLRRLPLDTSIRYAITTLASYAIAFVGLVIAGKLVGLHWDQIQWMATALTFGLAFGLQEVFANFVAGVIILFEQPVRVGDVVEIDNITGVVSKIRIRATTITDWNRKDYIVPNKEFITGKVLNWTRSDDTNRAVINVGVAYGSDTDRVRELLLQVAHAHPHVLEDPGPLASFEGFGDNSLNFVLRAFIGEMNKRLSTIHDLHTQINKTFAAAGIEISFPQRDLHIRSVSEPLLSQLGSVSGSGESAPQGNTGAGDNES